MKYVLASVFLINLVSCSLADKKLESSERTPQQVGEVGKSSFLTDSKQKTVDYFYQLERGTKITFKKDVYFAPNKDVQYIFDTADVWCKIELYQSSTNARTIKAGRVVIVKSGFEHGPLTIGKNKPSYGSQVNLLDLNLRAIVCSHNEEDLTIGKFLELTQDSLQFTTPDLIEL